MNSFDDGAKPRLQFSIRRRWLQFSLRGFLVAVTIGCVWLGSQASDARCRALTLQRLGRLKAEIIFAEESSQPWLWRLTRNNGFARVTAIQLVGPQFTDQDASMVASLRELERLTLSNMRILRTAEHQGAFPHFVINESEERRRRQHTGISDAGLRPIAGLRKLRWLAIDTPRITDKGLQHLEGCDSLNELVLQETGATVEGLNHLAQLKSLQTIVIWGGKFTNRSVAEVQQRCPTIRIVALVDKEVTRTLANENKESTFGDVDAWKELIDARNARTLSE